MLYKRFVFFLWEGNKKRVRFFDGEGRFFLARIKRLWPLNRILRGVDGFLKNHPPDICKVHASRLVFGMPDTRIEVRIKKRLSVRFGDDELKHVGYSCDVSSQGLFLEARTIYRPGMVLKVELKTRDGEIVLLEGKVRWAKKAPARANHLMKSGMGLHIQKFLEGEELFATFLSQQPLETASN